MSTFSLLKSAEDDLPHALFFALDAWASEVLVLRADALGEGNDPTREFRRLDDLFGSYKARDRLGRIESSDYVFVVRAIDDLFKSFTENIGRDWLGLTGMADQAGLGWWWARLPIAGPARDDYDLQQASEQ
jgi:hypothetical protein